MSADNLKLYEPFMLDQEIEGKFQPTIEKLKPKDRVELSEDTIL
jgi:hypothetical protein